MIGPGDSARRARARMRKANMLSRNAGLEILSEPGLGRGVNQTPDYCDNSNSAPPPPPP